MQPQRRGPEESDVLWMPGDGLRDVERRWSSWADELRGWGQGDLLAGSELPEAVADAVVAFEVASRRRALALAEQAEEMEAALRWAGDAVTGVEADLVRGLARGLAGMTQGSVRPWWR